MLINYRIFINYLLCWTAKLWSCPPRWPFWRASASGLFRSIEGNACLSSNVDPNSTQLNFLCSSTNLSVEYWRTCCFFNFFFVQHAFVYKKIPELLSFVNDRFSQLIKCLQLFIRFANLETQLCRIQSVCKKSIT